MSMLRVWVDAACLLGSGPKVKSQATVRNRDIVYLLPSKEICETGEDMWFKAYLIDKQTLALSDKSQTLYLQMRSEKGLRFCYVMRCRFL